MHRMGLSHYNHVAWGVLIAAFGVFFLIANLVSREILCFWPIFLIIAGGLKVFCSCCGSCDHSSRK